MHAPKHHYILAATPTNAFHVAELAEHPGHIAFVPMAPFLGKRSVAGSGRRRRRPGQDRPPKFGGRAPCHFRKFGISRRPLPPRFDEGDEIGRLEGAMARDVEKGSGRSYFIFLGCLPSFVFFSFPPLNLTCFCFLRSIRKGIADTFTAYTSCRPAQSHNNPTASLASLLTWLPRCKRTMVPRLTSFCANSAA